MTPMTFIPRTPQFGRKVCNIVMDTITAIAIPRSSHSVAFLPAARTTLDANTIHPEAMKLLVWCQKERLGKPTCEAKSNCLNCKHNGYQELRLPIHGLEVDFFTSTAWYHAAKLQPDGKTRSRK